MKKLMETFKAVQMPTPKKMVIKKGPKLAKVAKSFKAKVAGIKKPKMYTYGGS